MIKTSSSMSDPVYVIDGKLATTDEFKSLKPANIESIEVIKSVTPEMQKKYNIKDAEPGLIIITTKKSK